MRGRFRFILPAVTVMAVLATLGLGAALVSADGPEDEATTDGSMAVRGTGFLDAEGDGIAFVGGRGTVRLLEENGMLWVRDVNGDAEIDVTGYGRRVEFEDGWIQYAGVDGGATISGSRIIVGVAGTGIDLHARGVGRAMLWGHGTCVIIGAGGTEETRDWSGGLFRWHRFGAGSALPVPEL